TNEGIGRIDKNGKIIVEPNNKEIEVKENSFYKAKTFRNETVFYDTSGKKYEGFAGALNEGFIYAIKYLPGSKSIHQIYNQKLELINDQVKINYKSRFSYGYMQVTIEKMVINTKALWIKMGK
ncbi:TPA: hypothetical protein LWH92_002883, partial [Listeria innocua]|nr:hypothetical protein [Listeria innocua]